MASNKSSLVQIAQDQLDQANQSQKVTVVATVPGVQQEVDVAEIAGAAPSASNPLPVRLTDGSAFYSANAGFILDGSNVTAEQDTATPADNKGSPVVILPGQGQAPISPATSGNQVSTNAKLDTLISQTDGVEGSLTSIDGKTPALVSGRVPVDGSGVTQPISAASLPLPTGAATETTVASINTKTPALVSGAVPVISGLGVPAHDAVTASFGATTDTYTYKTGGVSGTTVSTVVITYTDATKAVLQSVVRT
jgi:hypothetical protein